MSRCLRRAVCALLVLAVVLAVWLKSGIYFETNDDRYITEILSGAMLGTADPHAVHIHYWLSLPLSLLYRITVQVPWYGGTLILFLAFAYFVFLDCVLGECGSIKQVPFFIAAVLAFLLLHFYLLGALQFTSVAAMLALSGWIYFLSDRSRLRRFAVFGVTSMLACLVRTDAMLLVQPLGLSVYAGLVLRKKGEDFRAKGKEIIIPMLFIGAVLAAASLGNIIGYWGEEWSEFRKYDQARARIFDYWGEPEYGEIKDILDKYGVTETEYEAWSNYDAMDWEVSADCAQEIEDFAKSGREEITPSQLWASFRQQMWGNDKWGINRISNLLSFVVLVLFVLTKRYALLLPLGLLQLAKLLIWGYLLYMGRAPLRVTIPLFACETALLWMLMRKGLSSEDSGKSPREEKRERYERRYKGLALLILCAFCCGAFFSGRQQYRYVAQQNRGQEVFMEGLRQIEDYCLKQPDNRYLLEAVSMSYYKGSALETEIYGERNSMVMGTWYSNSPVMRRALKNYLGQRGRGVHLIVYDDGRGEEHPAVAYLEEKTASSPVIADHLTVSHGGSYLVYYFSGDFRLTE